MREACLEGGLKRFRVANPNEYLGLSPQMEEDEMARVIGDDPVHLLPGGYVLLAEKLIAMVEDPRTVFQGEKREREDDRQEEYDMPTSNFNRRGKEWLFCSVSGAGAWRGGRGGRGRGGRPFGGRGYGGRGFGRGGGQYQYSF